MIERLTATDTAMSERFDRRVVWFFTWAMAAHLLLIAIDTILHGASLYAAWNLGSLAVAYLILRVSRDTFATFIFTHVYWTFSFATYAFAAIQMQSARYGLEAANLAGSIAFVSQLGLLAAFLASPGARKKRGRERPNPIVRDLVALSPILVMIGVFAVFADIFRIIPPFIIFSLKFFLFLAVGLRALKLRLAIATDPLTLFAFALIAFASVQSNERTELMAVLLFSAFLVVMAVERVITPLKAVAAFVVWRVFSVFSMILLAARYEAYFSSRSAAQIAVGHFFSAEAIEAFVNPFHTFKAYKAAADIDNPMRSAFFTAGDGISDRIVLLPYMDRFLGRFGEFQHFRVADIWSTLLSVLPSIGQDKNVLLSDRLTWEMGFRAINNIGRPMLTAETELYVMGGYALVFAFIGACFWFQYRMFEAITKLIGARTPVILVFTQVFIISIISTTSLSVLVGTIRLPLQLYFSLAIIKFLMLSTMGRKKPAMPMQSPA